MRYSHTIWCDSTSSTGFRARCYSVVGLVYNHTRLWQWKQDSEVVGFGVGGEGREGEGRSLF